MMNDKKTRIVVPVHSGKEVKPGLVSDNKGSCVN
jgi:predicted RNA binding protein YcfA (HicA-like mRNA interferase family)